MVLRMSLVNIRPCLSIQMVLRMGLVNIRPCLSNQHALKSLAVLLLLKDEEGGELAKQNQALFEELAETKRHYEMVSELYDQAVAQSGAAQLKVDRRRNTAQESQVFCLYPALAVADGPPLAL